MPPELQDLASRFRRFASQQARPSGPLYEQLALGISEDAEVLGLAAQATRSPVTNLLFAAVHCLLLEGRSHPLSRFYADLTPEPEPAEAAYPLFQSFCREYRKPLAEILTTRCTQTNEVRRCSWLAPGLSVVASRTPRFSMIDVGSSAGLHLVWRRFGYNYNGHRLGDPDSPVQLRCDLRGPEIPDFPETWPEPVEQTGIDLHPLNPCDASDRMWLRALVWPEHRDRAALLERALSLAAVSPPPVLAGDAFDLLPELITRTPAGTAVCVCHNLVLNQFSDPERVRFDRMLSELSSGREIYRLSGEWIATKDPELTLTLYRDGNKSQRLLAVVDDHGAWIRWARKL